MTEKMTQITLAQAKKLRSLSNAKKFKEMTDKEIDKMIEKDPDLYELTDVELAQFNLVRGQKDEKK